MNIYGHGKILLTAEYLVLHGAKALALPTKKGQSFTYTPNPGSQILNWKSYNHTGHCWFEAKFDSRSLTLIKSSDNETATRLEQLLRAVARQAQNGWNREGQVETRLEFDRQWGLGSSSTLVYFLGQWAEVNPYAILEETFGGSGYDIACAAGDGPLYYRRKGDSPRIEKAIFVPPCSRQLLFVYLNQKRNSRTAIKPLLNKKPTNTLIEQADALTQEMAKANTLEDFQRCMQEHEQMIQAYINQPTVHASLFSDFPGSIKSLGAWGGDFVLAASASPAENYFKTRGYTTYFAYHDFIL